jgi:hypothetical protein
MCVCTLLPTHVCLYTVVVCCAGKMPSRLARVPLDAPLRAIRVAAVVQAALLLTLCLLPAAAQVSTLTHSISNLLSIVVARK